MPNWKAASLPHFLIFFLVLLAGILSGHAAGSFAIAPPAAWVKVQSLASLASSTNSSDENIKYVLLDDQVNVSSAEHYHRIVQQPVNANGVQDCVQISMDFDPSYQRLVIHDICIRRGTNVINRLEPEKIKVIQQEKDLDMNIYNGESSAVLFLEDVQVGDEIDYSYTVTGSNPIFGGRYLDDFYLQWANTVDDERFRLLWPTNRYLGIKNHGGDVQPVVTQGGNTREYLWELHDVPSVNEEDSLPSWYDPYPWVQFSEFATWQDVAQWTLPLYPEPKQLGPEVQAKISEWEQAYPRPEARLAAALAFVQDEIRYMGIEVGPNSHQPNDPQLVFQRRFGDCKDKAYLFCTLLHAMGIDASEALVDTEDVYTVGKWLPSPYAFNHVVTRVALNGKVYWLDPTELHQGGAIDQRFFPNYGYCLLVRPGTKDLTAIPQQHAGWPKTTVTETFVVRGQKEPADFTVRTLAEGRDADDLRSTFADKRRDELQKNYLNYYAHQYPKIKTAAPLQVIDHREENEFETIEHYQIQGFWTLSDDKKNYECDFYPQLVRDLLDEPTTTLRGMPLAITYPNHEIFQTTVILPSPWPIEGETDHLQSAAAQLDTQRSISKNILRMSYDYQTLGDFVSTSSVPAYVTTLGQMKDALGYSLTWAKDDATAASPTSLDNINWSILALASAYLFLLMIVAIAIQVLAVLKPRSGIPPVLPDESERRLSGLGGWLILPCIGLVIGPIVNSLQIIKSAAVFAPDSWHNLTDPSGTAYNSLWAPVLISELLVNLTLIVFAILLLALFFQRRWMFPKLFIAFMLFAAIMATLDHLATHLIPAAARESAVFDRALAQNYLGCFVWIPYMLVSKRVKATFIK
jgi:transglutaminase-like putative cysteine protease